MNPDEQIRALWAELKKTQAMISQEDHRHNGYDMSRVFWSDLSQRKLYIHHTIYGATAATAANYSVFFNVPFACYVESFTVSHTTAGTDGGAVTLMLEKLTGTTAPGAGSSMLDSTLSLKATANTVQTGTITATLANKNLATGDRMALLLAGTPTSVANVSVLVGLNVI